ncbi:J domain-containing protein [Arthrobacter sp. NA-172]|uniref:J domain-containing protein n=1 Tax=Arthrobacter sp. NA-172 TaxID=3367524 RepID=UPI003754FF28
MTEHSPDPYEILHLDPAATAGDLARAYRALMRTHHPDATPPEATPAERQSRAQELPDIMDAYALLRDPAKRAAHDRQRHSPPLPEPAPHHRLHASSGAALIIGPVRWESRAAPAHSQRPGGPPDPSCWTLIRPAQTESPPAPEGYRILWWIHR